MRGGVFARISIINPVGGGEGGGVLPGQPLKNKIFDCLVALTFKPMAITCIVPHLHPMNNTLSI